jgi:hypothetical protein
MLYVIQDKSRIFLLHEGMHILLLPESSCAYEFTTCKLQKDSRWFYKILLEASYFSGLWYMQIFRINTNYSFTQKFIMVGKTNMSLSKVISLRSTRGFIESSYTLYHVSSVIIQKFYSCNYMVYNS